MVIAQTTSLVDEHLRVGERVVRVSRVNLDAFHANIAKNGTPWPEAAWAAFRLGKAYPDVPEDDQPLLAYVLTNQRILALNMGGELDDELPLARIDCFIDIDDFEPRFFMIPPKNEATDEGTFNVMYIDDLKEMRREIEAQIPKETS